MNLAAICMLLFGVLLGGLGNHFARMTGHYLIISVAFYAAGAACFLGQMHFGGNHLARMGLLWDLAAIAVVAMQGWVMYGEPFTSRYGVGLGLTFAAIFCFSE